MKIRKGDKVKIITGKDKGKTGKVLQVFTKEQKVIVEGLNLLVKNVRSRQQGQAGQQVQFPAPLHLSNIMLICPNCGEAVRVGYHLPKKEGNDNLKTKKVRRCTACQQAIE